jgi:hypothetical protein
MKSQTLLPIFLLLTSFFSGSLSAFEDSKIEGQWSKEATFLPYKDGIRKVEIASPDRRKIAIIGGVELSVVMDGKRIQGTEDEGISTLAELAWSPDSKAFFVTESYGGEVGEWVVWINVIEGERVRVINPAKDVSKSFKKHYKCYNAEEPNVGAVKWLNGGKHLLLVAEVPPHSSCPEMGKLRGYIVEIPTGKIVQEFDEAKLTTDWGPFLGKRFSGKQKR